ncbi:6323_t:CDS:2, partial [Racocetra persica]
ELSKIKGNECDWVNEGIIMISWIGAQSIQSTVLGVQIRVQYYDTGSHSWDVFLVAPSPGLENRSKYIAQVFSSPPENSTMILSGNRTIPEKNTLDIERITNSLDNHTTFMIRNILNKYTQQMLLDWLDKTYCGQYDFVYL